MSHAIWSVPLQLDYQFRVIDMVSTIYLRLTLEKIMGDAYRLL